MYLMKLMLWNTVPFRRSFDGIVNTLRVFEVLALSCFFVGDAKLSTISFDLHLGHYHREVRPLLA